MSFAKGPNINLSTVVGPGKFSTFIKERNADSIKMLMNIILSTKGAFFKCFRSSRMINQMNT